MYVGICVLSALAFESSATWGWPCLMLPTFLFLTMSMIMFTGFVSMRIKAGRFKNKTKVTFSFSSVLRPGHYKRTTVKRPMIQAQISKFSLQNDGYCCISSITIAINNFGMMGWVWHMYKGLCSLRMVLAYEWMFNFRLKKAIDIFHIFLTCRIFCHFLVLYSAKKKLSCRVAPLRDVNHCPIIALRLSESTRQVIPNLPK